MALIDEGKSRTVLVTGSRDWNDVNTIRSAFERLITDYPEVRNWTLVHGAARGADFLSAQIAKSFGWKLIEMKVTQEDWRRLGKKAGILRNTEMVQKHLPHHALAFQLDSSPGTTHCIGELNKYRGQINTRMKEAVRLYQKTTKEKTLDEHFVVQ